jgi:hypothetical protein
MNWTVELKKVFEPMIARQIKWASVYGNHGEFSIRKGSFILRTPS